MKKLLIFLLLCLPFALPAAAQESLLEGVVALCDQAYPAYIIAASDGWGDETQGQFALVLTDGEDNILCIAEKAETDAAYAFTVNNTNAVREGAQIPSLLMDTGGDVLFYAYLDDDLYKTDYRSVKENGEWGAVSVEYMDTSNSLTDLCIWSGVQNNHLYYDLQRYDKLENPADGSNLPRYMGIPVSMEFAKGLSLATFDIDMLSPNPAFLSAYPGMCDSLLAEGDTLLNLAVQSDTLIMHVEKADGTKRLRITNGWDEYKNDYAVTETGPLPEDAYMDTYHMWDGTLFLETRGGLCSYSFVRSMDGGWRLSGIQSESDFDIGFNYVTRNASYPYRNDGYVYGTPTWGTDLFTLDFSALPRTQGDALAALDQSRYAMVNNPNPADRLHLRAKPQKGAASLGKFYNRTPVYIIDNQDEWAFVRIGSVENGIEGWMMKEFLAFGSDANSVKSAFPQMHMVDAETPLRREPKIGLEPFAHVPAGHSEYFLIGVVDDEWYVVMTPDGTVGYARQAYFWEGNG